MFEIKAWLETKGYSFDDNDTWIDNYEADNFHGHYTTQLYAYNAGLTHWLERELGRNWRKIWSVLNAYPYEKIDPFTDAWNAEIEQAIKWHDALDENQD